MTHTRRLKPHHPSMARGQNRHYLARSLCCTILFLGGLPYHTQAATLSFPVGTTIDSIPNGFTSNSRITVGDYYVGATSGHFSINTSTSGGLHSGGIWNGSVVFNLATGIEIQRIDGLAFSLDSFTALEKPFFAACTNNVCLPDPFSVLGYAPGATTPFTLSLNTDNRNNTYDTLNVSGTDPRFHRVSRVIIQEQDTYVLDQVVVSTVPLPSSVWLLGSGLLGLSGIRKKRMTPL